MNTLGTSLSIQSAVIAFWVAVSASFMSCNREQQPQTTPQITQPQRQTPMVHQSQEPPRSRHDVSFPVIETEWVNLPVYILFAKGITELNDEDRAMLYEFHKIMVHRTNIVRIKVIGHSALEGSAESQQRIAQLRAKNVVDFFVDELGMSSDLFEIDYSSLGALTSSFTPQDLMLNRRVNFAFLVRRTSAHSKN